MSIRASLLALMTVALGATLALGCGGSSSSPDAAAVQQDLSSGEGCYAVAECAFECTAGDAMCVQGCIAEGTTTAQASYSNLITCGHSLCMGVDGGADTMDDGGDGGACATATDTSALCTQCVQNAIHSTTCAAFVTTCANE